MKSSVKGVLITVGAIVAVLLLSVSMVQCSQNTAIGMEEQVQEAKSEIDVYQKERVDKLYNLADCVKHYDAHEAETLIEVIKARGGSSNAEDIKSINTQISVVAEQYPELKANDNYKTLMTEISLMENKIAKVRSNYNKQVKEYKRYVRKFPTRIFLNITGYEVLDDLDYLVYNAPIDAPTNLFGDK